MRSKKFWNNYAKTYKSVENLAPHKKMLEDVAALVPPESSRILDAGCGSGALLKLLGNNHKDAELFGVDFSYEMLDRANKNVPKVITMQANLNNKLPYEDGYFDCVVSTNALYTTSSPCNFVKELQRVTSSSGTIIISSPKKRAAGLKILYKHFTSTPTLTATWDMLKFSTCLLPNFIIQKMGTKGDYHFLSEEDVMSLAENVVIQKDTFAGQNWLFTIC